MSFRFGNLGGELADAPLEFSLLPLKLINPDDARVAFLEELALTIQLPLNQGQLCHRRGFLRFEAGNLLFVLTLTVRQLGKLAIERFGSRRKEAPLYLQ